MRYTYGTHQRVAPAVEEHVGGRGGGVGVGRGHTQRQYRTSPSRVIARYGRASTALYGPPRISTADCRVALLHASYLYQSQERKIKWKTSRCSYTLYWEGSSLVTDSGTCG
eukprot:2805800-Rhodomonas_salina.4